MLRGRIDRQRTNSRAAVLSVGGGVLLIAALFLLQCDHVHPYLPFFTASVGSLVLALGIAMCCYGHWRNRR
jgi:drug/metabolite transporter (DMT)-like permease